MVKRVGGEFVHCPSHLLLDFLSSLLPSSTPCCVPSVFDASPAYPAVHGLIPRSDCGFPYAVNPRFYDVPFSPGESPQITQQRLNPAHLPRRVEESSPSLQSAERARGAALPAALWSTDLFHSALLRRVTTSVVTVLLRDGRVSVERLLSHVASEEVCRAVRRLLCRLVSRRGRSAPLHRVCAARERRGDFARLGLRVAGRLLAGHFARDHAASSGRARGCSAV